MKYRVLYTGSAFKDIQRLDPVAKKKLRKKIGVYSKKPFSYAKKLTNPVLGEYRWRIGNHRVVFDVDQEKIIVLRAGHRREIYKRD